MNRFCKNVLILSMLSLVLSFSGCNKAATSDNGTINIEQNSNEYESASVVDFTKNDNDSTEANNESKDNNTASEDNKLGENWLKFADMKECQEHFVTVVKEQLKTDGISYTGDVISVYDYSEEQLCYYVIREDGFPEIYVVFLDEFVNRMDGVVTVKDYEICKYRDIFSNAKALKAKYCYFYAIGHYTYEKETFVDTLLSRFGVAENKELFSKLSNPADALAVWFNLPEGAKVTDFVEADGNRVILELTLADGNNFYIYMESEDEIYYPEFLGGIKDNIAEKFVSNKKQKQFLNSLTMADIDNAEKDQKRILEAVLEFEERLYLLDETEGASIYAVPAGEYVVFSIGKEIFYRYIPWISPRFSTPRFEANDYDGDGEMEYLFMCTPNTGTGVNVDDVYYIDCVDGEYVFKELNSQALLDFVDDRLITEISASDGRILLTLYYEGDFQGTYDITDFAPDANTDFTFATYRGMLHYYVDETGIRLNVKSGLLFDQALTVRYEPEIEYDIKLKWVDDHFAVDEFSASSEVCQVK